MTKRSLFMMLAAGLVASVAMASPSQAGTVHVTAAFTVTGGTASNFEMLFTAPVTVTSLSGTPTPTDASAGNTVVLTFAPSAAGSFAFDVTSAGTVSAYFLTGLTTGVTASQLNVVITSAVPEPSSMALLGIGMTSFIGFRRFFKRRALA
jgi:hypothetical protein